MAQYLKTNKILFLMILIITIILHVKFLPILPASCESVQRYTISVNDIERLANANLNYINHEGCFFSERLLTELKRITPHYTNACYGGETFIRNTIRLLEDKYDESDNLVYLHAMAKIMVDHNYHTEFHENINVLMSAHYDLFVRITIMKMYNDKFTF